MKSTPRKLQTFIYFPFEYHIICICIHILYICIHIPIKYVCTYSRTVYTKRCSVLYVRVHMCNCVWTVKMLEKLYLHTHTEPIHMTELSVHIYSILSVFSLIIITFFLVSLQQRSGFSLKYCTILSDKIIR